jgi:hypothetical protein
VSAGALADALRAGLALDDHARYAERAIAAVAPYRRSRVLSVVREQVLPALQLGSSGQRP